MRELDIEISEIKNIKKAKVSIPLNRGIYGIIGNNGTGKSTIMTCLAQAVFSHSLDALREEDINEESYVLLSDGEKTAKWFRQGDKWKTVENPRKRVHYDGMYEGSLFYGTRFNDSKIVDDLLATSQIHDEDIVEADDYIKDNLSYILHVIFGLVIAVVGGTFIEKMHLENYVEDFIRNASAVDIDSPTLTQKERLEYAKDQVVSTFKKVFPYILVGVGIGALIHNWIPEVWVESILGSNNPFGVILATLIGIPMYADIFGTIPIAEALLAKGAQLGTILSFMMAVTTLSLPSLIMLRKAIKPKLLGIFIAICAIGIIVVGYVFNGLQNFLI